MAGRVEWGLVQSALCSGGCPWEEEIYGQLCLELWIKAEAVQWQWSGICSWSWVAGDCHWP